MTHEDDDEFEGDDNDCFSGIAYDLEEAGVERGHEFAEALIVLTRRLREDNGMEDADLDGPSFHHSLVHAIEGFSEGLIDHLSEEIMMDPDAISEALIHGAIASGAYVPVSSSHDHLHDTESEPSVVSEQIQALRERVAEGQALVAVGVDGESLDRELDGFLAGALEDIHSKAQERGQPVDLVLQRA